MDLMRDSNNMDRVSSIQLAVLHEDELERNEAGEILVLLRS